MKIFFLLLLFSNVAFAVFQWLVPYEQLLTPAPAPAVAEQLQLIGEPETVALGSEPDVASESEAVSTAIVQATVDQSLCYTLGPFKQQSVMQEAVNEFRRSGVDIASRSSAEQEYLGMMVYIDGHSNRAQAVATAEALQGRGIRDYLIVNEPGKSNALSLGVFGLKKNADRRQARISALGYTVKTEPRYRNRTIYWLDYAQPEDQNLGALVDGLKQNLGISRISRQCG